jgi:hypothetical protein
VLKVRLHACPYCEDSAHVYVSHVKTFWDLAAAVFMLQPVRCHSCLGRFYRPFFLKTQAAPLSRMKMKDPDENEDDRRSA